MGKHMENLVYYKAVSQNSSFLLCVWTFIFFHQFIQVLKHRTQNAVLTTDQHITWQVCQMKLSLSGISVGWSTSDRMWKTRTQISCCIVHYITFLYILLLVFVQSSCHEQKKIWTCQHAKNNLNSGWLCYR